MIGEVLVDTNVLVYAYDRSEPVKQRRALELLDYLARSQRGLLSTQVLSEFFVAVTRRIAAPLSLEEAAPRVAAYVHGWNVVEVTGLIVLEAIRGVQQHSLSFWDAQLWATARLNQVPLLMSEDFNSGATVEGVRFVNPFAPTFSMEEWSD